MRDPHREQPADPLVGSTLGGYRIRSVLGRGGSAVVYRAEQVELARDVALKVLNRSDDADALDQQVQAFRREARIAAQLDHVRLVRVYDVGEADGRHFLSMELIAGGNLARRIKRDGAMPWPEAVVIAKDIATALQCAHGHGLEHRDVKPANVLLTTDGRAKLADLGLAGTESHAGTAAFMSPEQVLRRAIDHRTDLYSLGCTTFAMLAGRPPFADRSSRKMREDHVRAQPPELGELGVELPTDLTDLVTDLLAKDPAERPQSAAEVIERLDAIAAGDSGEPMPRVRSRTARARRTRRREGSWAGMLLGLVLLGAIAIAAALAFKFLK
ncbi:MAG: serine/threonine protein kinase [Planctomycetes bacterium]|nr:serine/threonine protein kinase [Planctomycetota bacterium]MCB9869234.1 serine/threonine protein kinase [Planctomycetota bacterium]MCB9889367.1 serine/threonine protein kinase [Planctomycetota bacterium]